MPITVSVGQHRTVEHEQAQKTSQRQCVQYNVSFSHTFLLLWLFCYLEEDGRSGSIQKQDPLLVKGFGADMEYKKNPRIERTFDPGISLFYPRMRLRYQLQTTEANILTFTWAGLLTPGSSYVSGTHFIINQQYIVYEVSAGLTAPSPQSNFMRVASCGVRPRSQRRARP
jgi:hypothetical protein